MALEDDGTTAPSPDGEGSGGAALTPLQKERIIAWLESEGYHYFVDRDGDVGGIWSRIVVFFRIVGQRDEILQVRGVWNRRLALAHLHDLLATLNHWNHDKVFPKSYASVRDDGGITIVGEETIDFEHGVSDEQLAVVLDSNLSCLGSLFETLDEHYPDPYAPGPA